MPSRLPPILIMLDPVSGVLPILHHPEADTDVNLRLLYTGIPL